MKKLFSLVVAIVTVASALADPVALPECTIEGTVHVYEGAPRTKQQVKYLVNEGYVVCFSEELGIPLYSAYRLSKSATPNEPERYYERPEVFQQDMRVTNCLHEFDYTGTGYDRGHLAPNKAIRIQYGHLAQLQTFLMTNIVPQLPSLNRGAWAAIEHKILEEYSAESKDLWIISGIVPGVEEPKLFGERYVQIPQGYFKIILRRTFPRHQSVQALAMHFPHEPAKGKPTFTYVSVDQIERMTGLDFLWRLPDEEEEKIERRIRDGEWKLVPLPND